ncbi:MAG: MMPL family transporter [Sphaerochaeta sp.]|nr:MMPL family transporter [Sphaerochaeta sp.]
MKHSLLTFVGKHAKLTLVVVFVITAFFLYHTSFLTLDADYTTLMADVKPQSRYEGGAGKTALAYTPTPDTEIPETMSLTTKALGSHLRSESDGVVRPEESPFTSSYLVMVESPTLYSGATLSLIDETMNRLAESGYVGSPFSVLDFVTLEKRGSRLVSVPFSTAKEGYRWSDEEALELKSRMESDPIIKGYLASEDLSNILFSFESLPLTQEMEDELSDRLEVLREGGVNVYINGASVVTNRLMYFLSRDLSILLVVCFVAILTIYYLSFRAKRSVLLPFSMSVIGIIWTFGTMKLLGYTLNIVNIVIPCMVLNLGSSYAIHVIGEYYTDYPKGLNAVQSTQKILRTIVFACITTVIGFASLLFSKTPALREFGIAVGIGVTYCAILAATYLVALLSLVVPPKKEQITVYKRGYLAQAVLGIERLVMKHYKLFALVFVLIIAGFALTKEHIPINTNYMSYMPKRDPFYKSSKHFAVQMGGETPFILTLEAPDRQAQFFLNSENLKQVYDFESAVAAQCPDVTRILSFASYVSFANHVYSDQEGIPQTSGLLNLLGRMIMLISRQSEHSIGDIINADGTELTIYLQNYDSEEEDLSSIGSAKRIEATVLSLLPLLPSGTTVTISGEPHIGLHFSETLMNDQTRSTWISYLLVFLAVLIAFRSLSLALYSIIPVLCGVMANYVFMYLLNIPFDLITIIFSAVAVGAGIDYAIHFLIRYKNKVGLDGRSVQELLGETIRETGRPIILTSLSIVVGMLMLLFASYTPVRYFGTLMSLALLDCMLSTLFIMPSMIILVTKARERLTKRSSLATWR